MRLGVNIDHIATLREARGGIEPDPVKAVSMCEKAGCDSIVAHLREDRRHINDNDIMLLRKNISTRFNMEMSINKGIIDIAKKIRPDQVTLVPERRQELTTEGGLNIKAYIKEITRAVEALKKNSIEVSLFIDPEKRGIYAAKVMGVDAVEIHTGAYSLTNTRPSMKKEYDKIKKAVEYALSLGLIVNAGHGLNYSNVKNIAKIHGINELNIGHSIVSRAVFSGLYEAVSDMKALIS